MTVDGILMEANLPEIPPASPTDRAPVSLSIDVLNLGNEEAQEVEVQFTAVSSSGAADLIGNSSTENISFEVGGELQLKAVANRPNPFSSETWLTYVLTRETNAVRIKIYTTSGRLIYEVLDAPQMVGYNEVRWTGVDRDDEPVGNGVYLYKITVIGEDQQKLTQTHKMALVR